MNERHQEPEVDDRLADLRRRRAEAADVLAESLLDIYLQGKRAAREGRPWPPTLAAPSAPKPSPVRPPKGPPRRVLRLAEQDDLEIFRSLLASTWFQPSELDEQVVDGRRLRVVVELAGGVIGTAVLDEHGDLGVLRALSIDPHHRRRGHGAALAAFVIRLAYEHGLGSVYAVAASPWFLEEVGFQHIERVLLPRAALRLTSIANVPPAAYIFEITPSVAGRRCRLSRSPTACAPRSFVTRPARSLGLRARLRGAELMTESERPARSRGSAGLSG